MSRCRYYQCGGITFQVISDLPIQDTTFQPKFKLFEVEGPGDDTITIRHHFCLPDVANGNWASKSTANHPGQFTETAIHGFISGFNQVEKTTTTIA